LKGDVEHDQIRRGPRQPERVATGRRLPHVEAGVVSTLTSA
jgi:hypothetical protein